MSRRWRPRWEREWHRPRIKPIQWIIGIVIVIILILILQNNEGKLKTYLTSLSETLGSNFDNNQSVKNTESTNTKIEDIFNRVVGETEEVMVGLKCYQIGKGSGMLGYTIDETIERTCQEACLNKLMKYIPSYRCDVDTENLVCSCKVTAERKEILRRMGEAKKQEEMEIAQWKAQNPGKLHDSEVQKLCELSPCNGDLKSNQINFDWFECYCTINGAVDMDRDYIFDSRSGIQLSLEEAQERVRVYNEQKNK